MYHVELIDFPNYKVKECVIEDENGDYTVFIDARLSDQQQREALLHALKHMDHDDFARDDVQLIEYEAHKRGCD